MVSCPTCNVELESGSNKCHICGRSLPVDESVLIGTIDDKMTADLAREVLSSHGIAGMIKSPSGFFGDAGLPLQPFFKSGAPQFEVVVPAALVEDAVELLDMTIGDGWKRKDK